MAVDVSLIMDEWMDTLTPAPKLGTGFMVLTPKFRPYHFHIESSVQVIFFQS